ATTSISGGGRACSASGWCASLSRGAAGAARRRKGLGGEPRALPSASETGRIDRFENGRSVSEADDDVVAHISFPSRFAGSSPDRIAPRRVDGSGSTLG